MRSIGFFVAGIPAPGGSKTAFKHPHTGRIVVTDAGGKRTKEWRRYVVLVAKTHRLDPPLGPPIYLTLEFKLPRPKAHYNAKGLRVDAPEHHVIRPDVLKLARAVEDALTDSGIFADDAQITREIISKSYVFSDEPCVWIDVMGE